MGEAWDWVKSHPVISIAVAIGVVLLVWLLTGSSSSSTQTSSSSSGDLSAFYAAQASAAASGNALAAQNQQTAASLQAALANSSAAVQIAQIQATSKATSDSLAYQLGALQTTTQAQTSTQHDALAYQLGIAQSNNATDLGVLQSNNATDIAALQSNNATDIAALQSNNQTAVSAAQIQSDTTLGLSHDQTAQQAAQLAANVAVGAQAVDLQKAQLDATTAAIAQETAQQGQTYAFELGSQQNSAAFILGQGAQSIQAYQDLFNYNEAQQANQNATSVQLGQEANQAAADQQAFVLGQGAQALTAQQQGYTYSLGSQTIAAQQQETDAQIAAALSATNYATTSGIIENANNNATSLKALADQNITALEGSVLTAGMQTGGQIALTGPGGNTFGVNINTGGLTPAENAGNVIAYLRSLFGAAQPGNPAMAGA